MPRYPTKAPTLTAAGYENIRKSQGANFAEKRTHLVALLACGTDAVRAEQEHESRRLGKLRRGPSPRDLLPDEGLGVAVNENMFIKFTARAFSRTISQFKKQLDLCVSYHEKRAANQTPTTSETLAATSFLKAKVPARGDGNIWLFRNPDRDRDAFHGVEDGWLGHRLGLPVAPSGETRLTLGFRAVDVQDVSLPSYLDVPWTMLDLWDWNGRTKTLPRTPSMLTGLEEVVANPPEIGRINRPLVRLQLNPR